MNFISTQDKNFSQQYGFQRLGIHHVTVPPGCRTSYPHAESTEEEFVFVLSGKIDAWINGKIYALTSGWAIGFPAGTGICHSFINNSNSIVELLVVGEKTKPDNKYYYPINPELKPEHINSWWHNPPHQEMDNHNGLPGEFSSSLIGNPSSLPFAIHAPSLEQGKSFHYPGDNENFGHGVRLSNKLQLKTLAIWFEELPPGRRSAYPHAHTHEEEFAFVLAGTPSLWLNGEVTPLKPNDGIGFIPNSGDTHCLINNSQESAFYLAIGESTEFPDEKIFYPLHPLRNKECKRKKWSWENHPHKLIGHHLGKPNTPIAEHLNLRICSLSDAQEVLEIFNTSPNYFLKVDGCLPTIELAIKEISDEPNKKTVDYFKEALLIEYNDQAIGFVDLHCHHPDKGITYLGLLIISEKLSGQGLGRRCYELIEDYINRSFECKTIRLGVSMDHDVSGFWQAMGFTPNGRSYDWKAKSKMTHVIEFEKKLLS